MRWYSCCSAILLFLISYTAQARLTDFEITDRRPFAAGAAFGKTGVYEIIQGRAAFAANPKHPANQPIIDLDKISVDEEGLVYFFSDICILKPMDLRKGNGVILYDVNNRGNKVALRFFNEAGGNANALEEAGNAFLMQEGYTLVWSGWNAEIQPGDGRLRLHAPLVTEDGNDVTGLIRSEMVTDEPVDELPIQWDTVHGSYEPTERGLNESILTWRLREKDPRVPIPKEQWSFSVIPAEAIQGTQVLPLVKLRLPAGFQPGYIYELIYEGKGPLVMGLGFAAARDLVSWLRRSGDPQNPLLLEENTVGAPFAYGFGVSQSGRFLRDFLYQGFNTDEDGQIVFDGLLPVSAGAGRGCFNHRFATPTWTNMQHFGHSFPADRFPFTYGESTDPFTKQTAGIIHKTTDTEAVPKIFHIDTSSDYWSRSASLSHTDPLGETDTPVPDNVRFYYLAGAQHGFGTHPAKQATDKKYLSNPLDVRPFYRALLKAMDQWIREGKAPPPSAYPTIADTTLVDWAQASVGFPSIPGVWFPQVIQTPSCFDYGPDFLAKGIITIQPPIAKGDYRVKVPITDRDGNAVAGLRMPELAVPLATYTGWNLRTAAVGAENELVNLAGAYFPFPKTKTERERTGDPRLSIEERYESYADYVTKYEAHANLLYRDRYLLKEDVVPLIKQCAQFKDWFNAPEAAKEETKPVEEGNADTSEKK